MRLRLASKLGYVSLPSFCVQLEVMGNSIICQLLLSKKKKKKVIWTKNNSSMKFLPYLLHGVVSLLAS